MVPITAEAGFTWDSLARPFVEQGVIGILLLLLIVYLFKIDKRQADERENWKETFEKQYSEIVSISERSIETLTEIKTIIKNKK